MYNFSSEFLLSSITWWYLCFVCSLFYTQTLFLSEVNKWLFVLAHRHHSVIIVSAFLSTFTLKRKRMYITHFGTYQVNKNNLFLRKKKSKRFGLKNFKSIFFNLPQFRLDLIVAASEWKRKRESDTKRRKEKSETRIKKDRKMRNFTLLEINDT